MNSKKTFQVIKLSTLYSVVGNVILALFKLLAGFLSGSLAMLTDAIHSFSDLFTDVIVFFALKWSLKNPDEEHPYGHGKIENIAAVIVGILLVEVGVFFFYEAIKDFLTGHVAKLHNPIALWAAAISIVFKEGLFHITRFLAGRIKSEALYANAWHHRSDALSSVVALAGIGASFLGFAYGDLIGAVIIAVILMFIGIKIVKKNGNILVEASVPVEILKKCEAMIKKNAEIKGYSGLRLRQVGKDIYGEVNIQLDADLSIEEGHRIAHNLKQNIFSEIEDLKHISVHVDPVEK